MNRRYLWVLTAGRRERVENRSSKINTPSFPLAPSAMHAKNGRLKPSF